MGNCSKLVFLRENIEWTNKNTILIMLNIIIQRKYNLISFLFSYNDYYMYGYRYAYAFKMLARTRGWFTG